MHAIGDRIGALALAAGLATMTGCAAPSAATTARTPAIAFASPVEHGCEADGDPRVVADRVHVPSGLAVTTTGGVIVVRYATQKSEWRDVHIEPSTRKVLSTSAADPTIDVPQSAAVTVNGMPIRARIEPGIETNALFVDIAPDARTWMPLPMPIGDHDPLRAAHVTLDPSGRGIVAFTASSDTGMKVVVIPIVCR